MAGVPRGEIQGQKIIKENQKIEIEYLSQNYFNKECKGLILQVVGTN